MFIGPVFTRELRTAPRSLRHYVSRAVYPLALLTLMGTAWLVLTGTQMVRNTGDFARFGAILFQILAPLQLALAMFFSALLAVAAVAQEKDRRTFVLLLMTRLTNSELVLGKLLASMLSVLVTLLAALPFFVFVLLFGGVAPIQVAQCFAVTLAAMLATGSLGSLMALWREKTFQTVALTAVIIVLWIFVWEVVALVFADRMWWGHRAAEWAVALSPWRAVLRSTRPPLPAPGSNAFVGPWWASMPFVPWAFALTVAINALAIWRVRAWNPSREVIRHGKPPGPPSREPPQGKAEEAFGAVAKTDRAETAQGAKPTEEANQAEQASAVRTAGAVEPVASRRVWSNPVLWREMRTWAYGRRVLIVRLAYLALFVVSAASLAVIVGQEESLSRAQLAVPLVPLLLLSLVLVNAQAVTSITTEKDGRTFDLLLATDLTPKELIFGKLLGAFYNTKAMLLLPPALCGYLWFENAMSLENTLYLLGGLLVMDLFVAALGLHTGMTYSSSRNAIAVSLGTVFFLFVGVATAMRVMLAFSGTFEVQLQIFWPLTLGGGIGLYFALGWRNPSTAIGIAALACPFATFFAITSFLLGYTLQVFLVVVATYGFATAALLIPAIHEFDVTTGRTTASGV